MAALGLGEGADGTGTGEGDDGPALPHKGEAPSLSKAVLAGKGMGKGSTRPVSSSVGDEAAKMK